MPKLTTDEVDFVQGVSSQTGIDPRVLIAWVQGEGHPGDLYHNYLNIKTTTAQSLGVPTVGTAAAGTAEFGDPQTGIAATVREIKSLGLTSLAHQTPQTEIGQIAASPWASSHYGGPGGPNLQATFAGLFGSQALTGPWAPPPTTNMFAANGPGIVATNIGSPSGAASAVSHIPGVVQAEGAVGALSSVGDLISFITSWRFAEIVGGILLLIVGLFLVGRALGVSVPVGPLASPASSAGNAAPGPISQQPRRVQKRAGFTLDADKKPKRGQPGSAMLAEGDSLPY